MKIRNGFVSNSSSSSFIVAFPKKPKTAKEVLKYMFDGKEGGIGLDYYDNGLSYAQVSKIVFEDIDNGNAKNGTLKLLIEEMMYRYHYYSSRSHVITLSGDHDEDGGHWCERRGRYFGSNHKLMEELKRVIIEDDQRDESFHKREREILGKANLKNPPYAYEGGTDPYTEKPYTKKQIEDRRRYEKDMDNFRKTNPEYIAFSKEQDKFRHGKFESMDNIRRKLAEEDAKNFLDDNKGKYIFVVSYADEDGEQGGLMEHGNVFRNVPHIKISNH